MLIYIAKKLLKINVLYLFHGFAFGDDVLLGGLVPKWNRFMRKITYKIMKRFVQPNMYRLLRNGSLIYKMIAL